MYFPLQECTTFKRFYLYHDKGRVAASKYTCLQSKWFPCGLQTYKLHPPILSHPVSHVKLKLNWLRLSVSQLTTRGRLDCICVPRPPCVMSGVLNFEMLCTVKHADVNINIYRDKWKHTCLSRHTSNLYIYTVTIFLYLIYYLTVFVLWLSTQPTFSIRYTINEY